MDRVKVHERTPQSETYTLSGATDRRQPEIQSISWKKARGAAVIQYVDGSRFEGGIDDEKRRHGTGIYAMQSGNSSEGGWVHGDFEGCTIAAMDWTWGGGREGREC